jgi:hypothetical protein
MLPNFSSHHIVNSTKLKLIFQTFYQLQVAFCKLQVALLIFPQCETAFREGFVEGANRNVGVVLC